ncbi:thioredoxin domain-containing protein [Shewanella sp. KX20019]|uniref:DsbA family protein n=1 Tax=Shewanella sp. KX20019 TaxID=2803864 RepID=UPI0019260137|nr:DsbA family protein [Shewanella sp. KX20019]QQX81365.1 thioredoxin domain-containing protein [Shewanella sp. KX20019]
MNLTVKTKSIMGVTLAVMLAFIAIVAMSSTSVKADDNSLSTAQQQQVRAILKEMLINDPELLKEAIIAMQVREQGSQQASSTSLIEQQQQALFNTKTDPWKGAESPEFTMVYFTDFNCPYCKQLEPELEKLMAEFPQLKIIIKMVPLQGQGAVEAVELAQTVWLNEPEKYIALKDTLMSAPRRLDSATIAKVAKLTNTQGWLNNSDSRVDEIVDKNLQLMRHLGIRGTPSMIIGDQIIPGLVPFETLKQSVEKALEEQG